MPKCVNITDVAAGKSGDSFNQCVYSQMVIYNNKSEFIS